MQKLTYFFLLFVLWSFEASAFSVEHTFFVKVGSFDASTTTFRYTLDDKNYEIRSNVKTNGLFNAIYPFEATYTTAGKIFKNALIATDYEYTSQSRFNTRRKQVFFNSSGLPQYRISSKNTKQKKQIFDLPKMPADTYDLQSVLAKLTKQYNDLYFCDSKQTVFDGKNYFEVVFKDEGEEVLPENPYSVFSGKASKCSLKISKATTDDDDTLWQFAARRLIYFWIAKDKKTSRPFIALAKIKETPLGDLTAYLSNLKIEE